MDNTLEQKNPILVRIGVIAVLIICAVLLVLGISSIGSWSRQQNQVVDENSILHRNAKLEDVKVGDKVNIYFFWGNGCPHCEDLWEHWEELAAEHGDKFEVYGFEIWNNDDNQAIKDKFAEKMGDEVGVSTVPYFVIDDEAYLGYNSADDQKILDKILKSYEDLDKVDQHEELLK